MRPIISFFPFFKCLLGKKEYSGPAVGLFPLDLSLDVESEGTE